MINPAIETDLVGEIVRVDRFRQGAGDDPFKKNWTTECQGRVRAVTALPNGGMCLWVEVVDEEGRGLCNYGTNVGDLVMHAVSAPRLTSPNAVGAQSYDLRIAILRSRE